MDFFIEHVGVFAVSAAILLGSIGAAFVLRSTVSRAVVQGLTAIEHERVHVDFVRATAERERAERLAVNPWSASAFNMTKQIALMREDFDGAAATAREAGVDISGLRNAALYLDTSKVVIGDVEETDSHRERGDSAGRDNVDPSYFGLSSRKKVRKSKRAAKRSK